MSCFHRDEDGVVRDRMVLFRAVELSACRTPAQLANRVEFIVVASGWSGLRQRWDSVEEDTVTAGG